MIELTDKQHARLRATIKILSAVADGRTFSQLSAATGESGKMCREVTLRYLGPVRAKEPLTYDDALQAQIKGLARDGLSRRQIAEQMTASGVPMSRGQVCAFLWRNGVY